VRRLVRPGQANTRPTVCRCITTRWVRCSDSKGRDMTKLAWAWSHSTPSRPGKVRPTCSARWAASRWSARSRCRHRDRRAVCIVKWTNEEACASRRDDGVGSLCRDFTPTNIVRKDAEAGVTVRMAFETASAIAAKHRSAPEIRKASSRCISNRGDLEAESKTIGCGSIPQGVTVVV